MEFKNETIHNQEVKTLQNILKRKKGCYAFKSNQASNTLRNKNKGDTLDLSSLKEILEFNPEERWIRVEPRVTFATLCKYTLQFGFVPPVVPEFKTITVGGAIMGAALESSSHQFGQVSDICLEYELVLGNGEKIIASKETNEDLFYGISGSYGTLALLTAIKMQLIPAKKWIFLTCSTFNNLPATVDALTTTHHVPFVEGIILKQNQGVVIKGSWQDAPGKDLLKQKPYWSSWYIQQISQLSSPTFSMPTDEYLFRLDRAAFWMGRYVASPLALMRLLLHLKTPLMQNHTLNPSFLFRLLFNWSLSSKRLYQMWHRVPNKISQNLFFIHDFYTPFSRAFEALEKFMQQTQIFPIWLCPIRGTHTPQFLSPHFGQDAFLNIGLYGIPDSSLSIPELTAQLEKEILSFEGRKMLYSFTYYEKELFAKVYDSPRYEKLRKKFYAEHAFPTLYDKLT